MNYYRRMDLAAPENVWGGESDPEMVKQPEEVLKVITAAAAAV